MKFKSILLALSLVISFTSCKDNTEESDEVKVLETDTQAQEVGLNDNDVFATISGNPELSTYATALPGVTGSLGDNKAYTVFAPSNTAFSYYYQKQGTDVLGVKDRAVIKYHVVPERFNLDDIKSRIQAGQDSLRIRTSHGEELIATLENGQIMLHGNSGGKASISKTMDASNGTVHVITEVLIPRELDLKDETIVK